MIWNKLCKQTSRRADPSLIFIEKTFTTNLLIPFPQHSKDLARKNQPQEQHNQPPTRTEISRIFSQRLKITQKLRIFPNPRTFSHFVNVNRGKFERKYDNVYNSINAILNRTRWFSSYCNLSFVKYIVFLRNSITSSGTLH